jgi:uncharacterized membrane protein YjgN (DUF898 family)
VNSAQPIRTDHPIEFRGQTGEFFRIWIVNVMLTVVTLGIYSAWAKVRSKRYFYGNTYLDGSPFEYTADPAKILKGRLVAVGLLAVYWLSSTIYPQTEGFALLGLAILAPAMVVMSLQFRMRNSRWRGVRFNFVPAWGSAYALFLPIILYFAVLAFLSLWAVIDPAIMEQPGGAGAREAEQLFAYLAMIIGVGTLLAALAFPWWQHQYFRFLANRTEYGRHRFRYVGNAMEFYALYFLAVMIFIGGMVAVGTLAGVLFGLIASAWGENVPPALEILIGLLVLIPYALAAAQVQTARTNVVFNNLELGDLHVKSDLELKRMIFLYVTNTVAITLTLGLAIPWARIRMAKYRAQTLTLVAAGFENFVACADSDHEAYSEEMADVFGWEIGL